MCICNYQDPEEDLPEWPIPLGHPQLTWAIPVDIRKLGASLEAFADTLPRVTTLQLIHRFRDGPLSKIPQELLEQIIITVHRQAMKTFRSSWKTPFYCYRGVCHPNDHGETYNEHIESLWQRFFVDDDNIKLDEFEGITKDDCTPEQKLKMVENWMERDPSLEVDEYLWELHFMMRTEWVTKTCLCSVPGRSTGKFVPLNKILKSHFGLEVIILHEVLPVELGQFATPQSGLNARANYTRCFLKPANLQDTEVKIKYGSGLYNPLFEEAENFKANCQMIDPSQLILTETQRLRFKKALKRLQIKIYCHLTDLEASVEHPIEDEDLQQLCCCARSEDVCPWSDLHSWDKVHCLDRYLKKKSKELAKDSWPKLMLLCPSNVVVPFE